MHYERDKEQLALNCLLLFFLREQMGQNHQSVMVAVPPWLAQRGHKCYCFDFAFLSLACITLLVQSSSPAPALRPTHLQLINSPVVHHSVGWPLRKAVALIYSSLDY